MTTLSNNNTPHFTLVEQASPPANPAAGSQKMYVDVTDHLMKMKDSAGVVNVVGSSVLIQKVITETGAVATGTTIIPLDDTIPQNTEGTQFMTVVITPASATNILYIDIVFFGSPLTAAWIIVCLFQDSVAGALAAMHSYMATATGGVPVCFRHKMVAGTTSAITFKVRAGTHNANTLTFNGQSGVRYFGGVMASSIMVTEVAP